MESRNTQTWRLIVSPAADGAHNMAVDEAILLAAGSGEAPPTLRLYGWEPPCLSLGYAQPIDDADLSLLNSRGWDIVRRPTGGRAILHTDELTYAVVGPDSHPLLTGGVLESYQRLSLALLSALHRLDVPAQANPGKMASPDVRSTDPICFEVPSNYEITVDGKKLIGSAQARKRGAVLQHGSLPLHGDLSRIAEVLRYESDGDRLAARQRLLQRATTVEAVFGRQLSWQTATQAFVEAFKDELGLELTPGQLTAAERQVVDELLTDKYTNPAWTNRV